jgi:hypothetical protein
MGGVSKKKGKSDKVVCRENIVRLKGKRKGGYLKETVRMLNGEVEGYALAYVNPRLCWEDNGRVLGYDNAHGYHHRHFKGAVTEVEFIGYDELVSKFEAEVHELRRQEDGK